MSIGKKLIISGYLIMMPIILCIGIVLAVRNYYSMQQNARIQAMQNIRSVNEGIQLMCGEMEDICVYISVNESIKRMLTATASDVYILNRDSQVWVNRAPMKMVEDTAAHISTLKELRGSGIYQNAVDKRGKMVWTSAGKDGRILYQQNRKDKVVLYRERQLLISLYIIRWMHYCTGKSKIWTTKILRRIFWHCPTCSAWC